MVIDTVIDTIPVVKSKELNKRQKAYCYYRARNNTMEVSMTKAGYTCRGLSARNTGVKLEKNAYIQIQIEKERLTIFDKSKVTEESILENLTNISLYGEVEANRVRATELLGKYLAMFKEHQITEDLDKPFDFGQFRKSRANIKVDR